MNPFGAALPEAGAPKLKPVEAGFGAGEPKLNPPVAAGAEKPEI